MAKRPRKAKRAKPIVGGYPAGILTDPFDYSEGFIKVTDQGYLEFVHDYPARPIIAALAGNGQTFGHTTEQKKQFEDILLALKEYFDIRDEFRSSQFWEALAKKLMHKHLPALKPDSKLGAPEKDLFKKLGWLVIVREEQARLQTKKAGNKVFEPIATKYNRKSDNSDNSALSAEAVRGHYRRAIEALKAQPPELQQEVEAAIEAIVSDRLKTGRK
jgi:hypothetical protein